MAPKRIWIMDGHNVIFAVPPLQRLQVSDRREEAREGLVNRMERFAIARGERVLVVFDGNQRLGDPEAVRSPLLQVVYARRGEGEADLLILREARACFARGLPVTVVTNDVSTLARNLPRGVNHLGVEEFWLKHIGKGRAGSDLDGGDKRVMADVSDLEREMLRQAALSEPAFQAPQPVPRQARAGRGVAASPGAGPPRGAQGAGAMPDRVRLKREKGRLRQERRLRRHAAARRRR